MNKFYSLLYFSLLFLIAENGFAQIAAEGFENTTYFSMSSTGTLSNFLSGNSAAGDLPASSPLKAVGTYAYGVNNGTTTLISETYDTRCYTSVTMQFRLAAFSYGSSANGLDATDNVIVYVSTDGGITYTQYLEVDGNSQAYWSYAGGTGIATTAYPTSTTYAPAAGGSRTTDGYSTLRITSLPNTANLVIKIVADNNSATELWTIDDFKITGTANTGASSPTAPTGITFSQVGCNAFLVSWTNGNGNADLVAVKAGSAVTGSPTLGTGYTLTNSNGALFGIGSTLNASEYVVYNSNGGSVLVYGLAPATTYYVSIWESNCFKYNATALTGNVTTTSCSYCPQMNSVLVDGCNTPSCGAGNEGLTEMAFFNSGSFSIPANTNAVGYNFDQVTNPPTQSYSEIINENPTTISTMNTAAGCGTLFVDAATAGYIPPYSTFVILNNLFCPTDYNMSSLCALAPIYVIFTTSQNWNTSGNYTNHGCPSPNDKYWFTDFSQAGITCVHYYYYDACLLYNGDGGYITYAATQTTNTTSATTLAPAVYSASGSCTLPVVLPVNLVEFKTELSDANTAHLQFTTINESNLKQYILSKSYDGVTYTSFDRRSAYNTSEQINYHSYDRVDKSMGNIVYYRLQEEDFNGEKKYIGSSFVNLKPNNKDVIVNLNEEGIAVLMPVSAKSIELVTLDGQNLIMISGTENELSYQINTTSFAKGFYLLRITDINDKITIKKITN